VDAAALRAAAVRRMSANTVNSVRTTTAAALSLETGQPLFQWPIEPQYTPLAHDFYRVSSGDATVFGFTHNNGKRREKHYVYPATRRSHYGFDITAAPGTPVHAVCDGVVTGVYASYDEATQSSDYGHYIILSHAGAPDGQRIFSLYAHLQRVDVKAGDSVKKDAVIGASGNTGGSRIPHLHVEFRLGENTHARNVDPLQLLPARDLGAIDRVPSEAEGFPASSVGLYQRMLISDWDYEVFVRTRADKVFADGTVIPARTELTLTDRQDGAFSAAVRYAGQTFQYALDELLYTF
jgi:murein DD-endopeptidase MepM/ murein hydrolase activator NlpD